MTLLFKVAHGFLRPCQNLVITNDPILRKHLGRDTEERKDREFFIRSFQLAEREKKKKCMDLGPSTSNHATYFLKTLSMTITIIL